MYFDEQPGLGATILTDFAIQASTTYQSTLCLLPTQPLAVSRICQALPWLCTVNFCSFHPHATPPLPLSEQTALSSQESAQDSPPLCPFPCQPHPRQGWMLPL